MVSLLALASVAAYLTSVAAHGGVIGLAIGSTNYTGWSPYNPASGQVSAERPYASFNPITNAVDATLRKHRTLSIAAPALTFEIDCNDDGTSSPGQQSISIAPGQGLTGNDVCGLGLSCIRVNI